MIGKASLAFELVHFVSVESHINPPVYFDVHWTFNESHSFELCKSVSDFCSENNRCCFVDNSTTVYSVQLHQWHSYYFLQTAEINLFLLATPAFEWMWARIINSVLSCSSNILQYSFGKEQKNEIDSTNLYNESNVTLSRS